MNGHRKAGIWFALLIEIAVLVAFTSLLSRSGGSISFESSFLNYSNISQVLNALSFVAIMAVGHAVVIMSDGIDPTAGSVLGLCEVVTPFLLKP